MQIFKTIHIVIIHIVPKLVVWGRKAMLDSLPSSCFQMIWARFRDKRYFKNLISKILNNEIYKYYRKRGLFEKLYEKYSKEENSFTWEGEITVTKMSMYHGHLVLCSVTNGLIPNNQEFSN